MVRQFEVEAILGILVKSLRNFTHRMCRLIGDSIFLRSMQNYLNLK